MIIDENRISHESHHHILELEDSFSRFRCDGCKLEGIGKRYRCGACNFDLHKHCGVDAGTHVSHHLYPKCNNLVFSLRPPADGLWHTCEACKKTVTGSSYRCGRCDIDLHPCCAKLPMQLEDGGVKLKLMERNGKWIYRSTCKRLMLEVSCARELIEESTELLGSEMTSVPKIKNMIQTTHSKGRVTRCCEMAGLALKMVISALLGDPTSLIIAVIASFMPRG